LAAKIPNPKMRKKFIGKEWFFEEFLPGEPQRSTWGFLIEKKIFSGKSKFQKIEIFENEEYGRILVLDGEVQLSTKFEYIYHEMLVHPAMLYHKNPHKVLIIGGGDGGCAREVVKYPVKEIYLVDIDKKVIEVSKKYLPSVSAGAFKDKRVKIFNEDAFKFLEKYPNFFDVIIDDLTDPKGPSLPLWGERFYQKIFRALKRGGIVSMQAGYLREKFSSRLRKKIEKHFKFFVLHSAFVDCFPMGEHVFFIGSKDFDFYKVSFKEILRKFTKLKLKTRYYTPKIHFCSRL
jgi:spermidine synthase